jgi:CheY-like chemotaxis protein
MNLIDVDRSFIKSSTIDFPSQIPRDESICSHLVGDTTGKDVLIVPNLLESCFKDLPSVQAGCRFYAGAALIIAGYKIGTLCLLAYEPNYNFDMAQKMTLLDLASTLSYILEQKRNAKMIRNNVLTNITHNLLTPLSSLGMQLPFLEKELLAKRDVTPTLQEINKSFRRLHRTVETNIILSKLCDFVEAGRMIKEVFDMKSFVIPVKKLMLDVRDEAKVLLNVDPILEEFSGLLYLTYPKVLELMVISSINQYIAQTSKLMVEITFQSISEGGSKNEQKNEVISQLPGFIVVSVEFTENKEYCSISQQSNEFECDSILKLIGGVSKLTVEENKTNLKLLLPCTQETKINHENKQTPVIELENKVETVTKASIDSSISFANGSTSSNVYEKSTGRRLKVLIVEDSIPLLKTLSRWLRSVECDVTTAENGKLGLMQLIGGEKFDVVIFDFLMPVMNGVEMMVAYKKWKDMHENEANFDAISVPLMIGTSATPPQSEADLLRECGMMLFFPKPINWSKLNKVLALLRENEVNTALQIAILLVKCRDNVFTSSFAASF